MKNIVQSLRYINKKDFIYYLGIFAKLIVLFALIYFDPISVGVLKIGQIWKAILLIYFLYILLNNKFDIPLIFIIFLFIIKFLLNINFTTGILLNLSESLSYLVLPVSIYFFYYQFKQNISGLNQIILVLSLFYIYSGLPFILGIIPQLGRYYDLSKFGIDSFSGFTGLFYHVNITAKVLVVSLLVVISNLKEFKIHSLMYNVLIGAIILGIFSVVINFTKNAWFSLIIGLGVYSFFEIKNRKKYLMIISSVVLMLGFFVILTYNNDSIYKKLTGNIDGHKVTVASFTSGRNVFVKTALGYLSEEPIGFIFGLGKEVSLKKMEEKIGLPISAHSKLIDVLQYSGIIGLIIYSFFLYGLLKIIIKSLKLSNPNGLIISLTTLFFLYMIPSHGFPIWCDVLYGGVVANYLLSNNIELNNI